MISALIPVLNLHHSFSTFSIRFTRRQCFPNILLPFFAPIIRIRDHAQNETTKLVALGLGNPSVSISVTGNGHSRAPCRPRDSRSKLLTLVVVDQSEKNGHEWTLNGHGYRMGCVVILVKELDGWQGLSSSQSFEGVGGWNQGLGREELFRKVLIK